MELLLLALMMLIGWGLRVRSLYYALSISEIFILMAILKIIPLMELSVNDLIIMAFFMLLNNVVLQLPFFGGPGFLHIAPFLLMLLLELLVLVRVIHQRKRGYGIVVGYAVLCCWGVLVVYRKWERFVLDYYLAREGEFDFAVKALYLLTCMVIISVPVILIIRCLSIFLKKWLIKLQEYSVTYTEIDRSIVVVMILTLGTLSMRELVRILLPFLSAEDTSEMPLLWTGFSFMMVMIQIIYIRLLVKSISVKEEMHLLEKDMHQLAEYNRELEKIWKI